MITRNLGKVQEALDDLNPVQRNINELKYYKNALNSPNHSNSECSSVRSIIDTLTQQHSEVVNALILYGTTYQEMDERLAAHNDPKYQPTGERLDFSYVSAPDHQKGFWEKTWNQITLGDYSDDVTWLGSIVSMGLAFTGFDAPLDIRDFTANVSKGQWGWAAVSVISLIPVVGILGKGAKVLSKGAKAFDTAAEIIDATSPVIKQSGNVIDAGFTGTRLGGKYSDVFVQGEGMLFEVHHMPSDSVSSLSRSKGPAIRMDKLDHKSTASYDHIDGAQEFRDAQKELINSGNFHKALQMDIDDIRRNFGNKYDLHISELLKYVNELDEQGVIK